MEGPADRRQVPAYVALVRIIAVIGMSTALAAGIFLVLLWDNNTWIWGLLCMLGAIPCFALMRLVEDVGKPPEAS